MLYFYNPMVDNYKTYDYNTEEEDWSENEGKGSQENVETFSNVTSTPVSDFCLYSMFLLLL